MGKGPKKPEKVTFASLAAKGRALGRHAKGSAMKLSFVEPSAKKGNTKWNGPRPEKSKSSALEKVFM